MVAGEELRRLASWNEESTNAEAIATALRDLWQHAAQALGAQDQSGAGEGGILRTRVLNFVAYATSAGVSERAEAALARLAGTHPSRSILMLAQPQDDQPSLGASLQVYCHTGPGGGHRLCFDQVQLRAGGSAAEHLPGVATRLLIHDLPALLWWPGDPPVDAPHFGAMAKTCDVLIVDSSEFGSPAQQLQALARFARAARAEPAVVDLNWDRLIEWREIAAQCFDAGSARARLEQIERAEITFVSDAYRPGCSAQALLLAGWLASRLGWQPLTGVRVAGDGGDSAVVQFRRGARTIEMRLTAAQAENGVAGTVSGLRLEAPGAESPSSFEIAAADDRSHGTATAVLDGGPAVTHAFPFEAPSESRLLSEEIEAVGADCALADALEMAATIAREITD